jgi:hypothetical protein
METETQSVMQQVRELVDQYRQRCLWFLRADYQPQTIAEALRVLRAIEQHGDLAAHKRAAGLRQWLLQHSNDTSVA